MSTTTTTLTAKLVRPQRWGLIALLAVTLLVAINYIAKNAIPYFSLNPEFFRLLRVAGIGTVLERAGAASWFCWAVPLLICEAILQGRKIFSARNV